MASKTPASLLALGIGLIVGTESFAYVAHLAPELGRPLYRVSVFAFYAPWMLGIWAWQWGWLIPRAFLLPSLTGAAVALVVLVKSWPVPQDRPAEAHWARRQEWTRAECMSRTGVVLGKWR
jgi:hypothetical protein